MTPFEFFTTAGWILAGVVLLAIAAVIVYSVVVGLKNHAAERRRNRGYKLPNCKGKN